MGKKERRAVQEAPSLPVTDPLEAMNIGIRPADPPPPPPPAPAKLFAPSGEVEPPHPPVKRYRVEAPSVVHLHGQIVRLNKGDVVSEASYGPAGMRRIFESKVALAELGG